MTDDTLKVIFPEEDDAPAGADGATRRVGEDLAVATRRMTVGEDGTVRVEWVRQGGRRLALGVLPPGAILCGDCRVECTLHPHETERPGLYLCQAPEGRVVVKVYAGNYPPKPELWEKLPRLDHPNVLTIYRTLDDDGFYCEVQEYCAGGTLFDRVPRLGSGVPPASPEWVASAFIPQVNEGLRYLHEHDVVHRDIKPANIYIKEEGGRETLVLADFDISSVLDQTRTSRDTQRAGGTWLYTAPEAFPRFVDDHASSRRGRISRGSDYYSLGITLIELLMGTTSLHLCQLPDLFDFYLQGGRVEIPRGIPSRLALLLRGLLIRNRRTRWGYEEVARWIAGQNSDADLQKIHDDEFYELARAGRPYRLGELVAVDLPTLADAMSREQETAKEDLMGGEVLLNWIGTLDPNLARQIRRDREYWRQQPDVALLCAIIRCDPTRPFLFADGTEVYTAEEWLRHAIHVVSQSPGLIEGYATNVLLHQLEHWLRLKAEPEEMLADGVLDIAYSPMRVRLEELAYLFQPERPYYVMRGVALRTPKEIVEFTYGKPEDWKRKRPACYDAAYQRWFEGGLCAWMRQRGLIELAKQADEIRDGMPDDPAAAFETILRLLDPALPPVQLEADLSHLAQGSVIFFGQKRAVSIRYRTRSAGVPFGAFTLANAPPGVAIVDGLVRKRDGTVELTIDSTHDIAVFKKYPVELTFTSGIAALAGRVSFIFEVQYPTSETVNRCLIGAGIGAGLLMLPRLVLAILNSIYSTASSVVTLDNILDPGLWGRITNLEYPRWPLVTAFLLLAVGIYFACWCWVRALRGSKA
ncbi:MAG TPA: protein kinase, partial [Armatimonadota bacterium]|nr:protein kinase [Armatimonadota bacterium]